MELDFDNEIDALVRKEAAGRTITIGEFVGLHLDADEIAAFAEGAVPETTRQTFIRHFADCDACRKTLSHAIVLNAAEAAPEPSIAAPVGVAVPWYRRLFLFPNLAYVMGGLVVLFAGFIGLSVLTYQSGQMEMSKIGSADQKQEPAEAMPVASAPLGNMNSSANTAANMANAAATAPFGGSAPASAANASSNTTFAKEAPATEAIDEDRLAQPSAAAPPPPAKDNNFAVDGADAKKMQELRSVSSADRERDKKAEVSKSVQEALPRSAPMPKLPGPMRNEQSERNVALEAEKERAKRKADKPSSSTADAMVTAAPGKKRVSGRTFEFRQGAWYDTTYRGQGTINVRRNTDDYRKLDGGLRGIAESFIGTVVVTIWNGRAYRIQ